LVKGARGGKSTSDATFGRTIGLRLKALDRISSLAAKDTYNFSVVFTADEDVRRRVQGRFLRFLKEVEDEVKQARAEDVYQLNFDLFKWS